MTFRIYKIQETITFDDVIKVTGFELLIADKVGITSPPSSEDVRILHDVIDPHGFVKK